MCYLFIVIAGSRVDLDQLRSMHVTFIYEEIIVDIETVAVQREHCCHRDPAVTLAPKRAVDVWMPGRRRHYACMHACATLR
jgi:hypothetical protein